MPDMNRFFFHYSSKTETFRDDQGRDFSDLSAAHRHAMLLIHKALLHDEVDWRGWSIRITDANDQSLLDVLFARRRILPSAEDQGGSVMTPLTHTGRCDAKGPILPEAFGARNPVKE